MKEYWIIDPAERKITHLVLEGQRFNVIGEFVPGQRVTSQILPELAIDADACMAAADKAAKNDEPKQV